MPEGKAASRYEELISRRSPFLEQARDCSKLTIPSLIPPDGTSGNKLYRPFQSVGARGVNNLAGKLLLTLFPPASTFFRLIPDEQVQNQLQEGEETDLEEALSNVEQSILKNIEKRGLRASVTESMKHLIAAGNVLLHLPSRKSTKKRPPGLRVFPLSQYVVERDPEGTILDIVVKEIVSPKVLPIEIRQQIIEKMKEDRQDKTVELYTMISRADGESAGWTIMQEVKGMIVPGSEGTYPEDKLPWLALRWTRLDNEDYGRGLCEEYYGDLRTLEGLQQAIVEGAAAAARVLFLVNPGGQTKIKDLQDAPNGAIRAGKEGDVTVVGLDKFNDFTVAANTADKTERRLEQAFLLHSSVQRDAERVTAEEIRYLAAELEDALGGTYSVLSAEFQLPLVTLVMAQMVKEKSISPLKDGVVTPTIIAGLDSLGRTHELQKLDAFTGGSLQLLGPQAANALNMSEILRRRAIALGLPAKKLIKSDQQIQQEQQQAQMAELAGKIGPSAVTSAAKVATATPTQQPTEQ